MKLQLAIVTIVAIAAIALSAVLISASRSESQAYNVDKLTIAIYTPTVQFDNSAARLAYVQGIAKSVGANTGVRVNGLSFTSLGKLVSAKPDFAIVDAQCYASNMGWNLLASARIGGRTSRAWGLYSRSSSNLGRLKGKKLAYVKMGCNDSGFVDNAMLESEIGSKFFGKRIGKTDLAGAVAEVATYKGAQAVFAPTGSQKGLSKMFDTGSIPNPAFVQLNSRLPKGLVAKVRKSVVGYGGSSAIAGWAAGNDRPYRDLRRRMAKRVKRGLFASPDPVRINPSDVLVEPSTMTETALPEIEQNFEKPPERQE